MGRSPWIVAGLLMAVPVAFCIWFALADRGAPAASDRSSPTRSLTDFAPEPLTPAGVHTPEPIKAAVPEPTRNDPLPNEASAPQPVLGAEEAGHATIAPAEAATVDASPSRHDLAPPPSSSPSPPEPLSPEQLHPRRRGIPL